LTEQTLTNLSATVANFRVVSEHALVAVDNVNSLVVSNRPSVTFAVSNLLYFSQQVNEFAASFSAVVATNTTDIGKAVKNIESSTVVLKNLLDDLEAGKGLAGSLIKNEGMASNVSEIVNNLSVTTSNLNRLGVWGILWQRKPPLTNAPPVGVLAAPKHPVK
jgi:phospholipid/cholesterol/gamma-HCH transport system substrate-binding protein